MNNDNEYIIEVENLVAGYGDKVILKGVDFKVKRGEIMVILGGSGCGKSTLMKNIVRLNDPTSGKIRLFDRNMMTISEDDLFVLLRRIGMLYQYGAMFGSMTVGDNISLPMREHTDLSEDVIHQIVKMKLALVGLSGTENLLPSELSGGMRKRAALARSVSLDPEVLFCDEPSAGLDPIAAAGLDGLLIKLRDLFGMSIIVVTHEMESVKLIADKITMLDKGKVVAVGTVDELKKSTHPFVSNFFKRTAPDERHGFTGLDEELL